MVFWQLLVNGTVRLLTPSRYTVALLGGGIGAYYLAIHPEIDHGPIDRTDDFATLELLQITEQDKEDAKSFIDDAMRSIMRRLANPPEK